MLQMGNISISDSLKFAVEFTDKVIEEIVSFEESKTRLACDKLTLSSLHLYTIQLVLVSYVKTMTSEALRDQI